MDAGIHVAGGGFRQVCVDTACGTRGAGREIMRRVPHHAPDLQRNGLVTPVKHPVLVVRRIPPITPAGGCPAGGR